jgi:hypothetical protein
MSDFVLEHCPECECFPCQCDAEIDDREYCMTCNNLGIIPCECGGDICVCMNNGEMLCPECNE